MPTNQWTAVPALAAGFRGWQQSSYDPVRKKIVTFGGSVTTYYNDTVVVDLVARTRTQRRPQPDLPAPGHKVPYSRDGHCFFYHPPTDRHWLLGGWSGGLTPASSPDPDVIKTAAAYDEQNDVWEDRPISGLIFNNGGYYPIGSATAIHPATGRVLYGGTNRLWYWLDLTTQTATHITTAGPQTWVNGPHTAVWVPPLGKFIVYDAPGKLWYFDPATNAFTAAPPTSPYPPGREWATLAWEAHNGVVVLAAGTTQGTETPPVPAISRRDLWAWKPETNTWTELSATLGEIPMGAQNWSHTLVAPGDGSLWIVPQGALEMTLLDLGGGPPPPPTYAINVETTGTGLGTCNLSPAGPYLSGTAVQATATPAGDSTFVAWDGDVPHTTTPTMTMMVAGKDLAVTAQFDLKPVVDPPDPPTGVLELPRGTYVLKPGDVITVGPGSGTPPDPPDPPDPVTHAVTVAITGVGAVAGAGTYTHGATATLTATPGQGHKFEAWSGDLVSQSPVATLVVDADKAVTALFKPSGGTTLPPPTDPSPDFAAQRWTIKSTASMAGDGALAPALGTFSKHMRGEIHPPTGRLYLNGGDHGGGRQPDGSYFLYQSGRQEMYWYDIGLHESHLEQHFCRVDGGLQPTGPDEMGWSWDPSRGVFWNLWGFHWDRTTPGSEGHCPGATAAIPLWYDPELGEWRKPDRTTPPQPWGGSSVPNFAHYDALSDTFYFASYTGGGNGVFWYNATSNTFGSKGGSGEMLAWASWHDTKPAYDPDARCLYILPPSKNALVRFDIPTQTFTNLGPIPDLPGGAPGSENMPVWDSVSKVLLYPHLGSDQSITLYAYDPRTSTWTPQPMPVGETVRGLHAVFSPSQNVLMIWGHDAKFFFYRYGEPPSG